MRKFDGRAIAGESAEGGRDADRSAGVRADGRRLLSLLARWLRRRLKSRRSACTASRGWVSVAVVGIFAGDSVGQGMQMRLADDGWRLALFNRAATAESSRAGGDCVARRNFVPAWCDGIRRSRSSLSVRSACRTAVVSLCSAAPTPPRNRDGKSSASAITRFASSARYTFFPGVAVCVRKGVAQRLARRQAPREQFRSQCLYRTCSR